MYGYGGKILTVDVGSGAQRIEEFDPAFARAYLGGNGFAAKLCYDRVPPGIDAFDPRNLVIFATGPVTDSAIPGNNRGCVGGKSPLNGLFFDSTFGGRFAGTQRHTGFDAIVDHRAPRTSRSTRGGRTGATLKPAKTFWGKRTLEAGRAIQEAEGAGKRRDEHRAGRREPGPLLRPGPLLAQPRGIRGPRRPGIRAGIQARQGASSCAGARRPSSPTRRP